MINEKKNFILILSLSLVFLIVVASWIYMRNPKIIKDVSFRKDIEVLKTQSSSDTIDSIEKDLDETDLSDIDKELVDIENELNTVE